MISREHLETWLETVADLVEDSVTYDRLGEYQIGKSIRIIHHEEMAEMHDLDTGLCHAARDRKALLALGALVLLSYSVR